MLVKSLVAIILFVLGLVVGVSIPYGYLSQGSGAPKRPTNVPQGAKWAGGAEGGAWIECKPFSPAAFTCRAYADITGVLMEEESEFTLDANSVRPKYYSAGLIGAEVIFKVAE